MAAEMTIVGIGASAGGLEALQALFGPMPTDSGMAFVVITHLAPGHPSAMAAILGRATGMPVREVQDGTVVQPDHVYVGPPGGLVTIADNRLRVQPLEPGGPVRHAVDVFLGSLAEHAGEHAVGIVLSGSGTDGTLGVKAIKERGGLTMAQGADHTPPRHTGMPDSAIASGLVDVVLPVERMPEALLGHLHAGERLEELTATSADGGPGLAQPAAAPLTTIHYILRERLGHDFSGYKRSSFLRRVQYRMLAVQIPDMAAYVERLQREPEEARLLLRGLLIGVTNFFRDGDAFAALEQLVLPRLFEAKGADDQLRVWVPGCATGEEAYSLLIPH